MLMDVYTLPSTRAEALAAGLDRYFSGEPCRQGHVSPRNKHGSCLECSRLRQGQRRAIPEGAEAHREASRKWRSTEAGKAVTAQYSRATSSTRRMAWRGREKAIPKWADRQSIYEFLESRPLGYHLDHILPLRGESVCGLHVLENLQFIPAAANMAKSNRVIPITLTAAICPI